MACNFELIDYGALYPIEFSVEQLDLQTGLPISKKQSVKLQVPYPRDDIKYPWFHYIVFNSHQNAMWPIFVDRLVMNRNIEMPIKRGNLLITKKKFPTLGM